MSAVRNTEEIATAANQARCRLRRMTRSRRDLVAPPLTHPVAREGRQIARTRWEGGKAAIDDRQCAVPKLGNEYLPRFP